jgi:hypothetical protein
VTTANGFHRRQTALLVSNAPPMQTSPTVQKSPSSQIEPSGILTATQIPLEGLHVKFLQGLECVPQNFGTPPHTPDVQVSDSVHGLPSLQGAPLGACASAQLPVAASHSAETHCAPLGAAHGFGRPRHVPAMHWSSTVQCNSSSGGGGSNFS